LGRQQKERLLARSEPREFQVVGCAQVTPNMRRITLGGEGMKTFPENQDAAYVKLRLLQPNSDRSLVRTYTVRSQRADEIDVDFALHEKCGPATQWALDAQIGDKILVAGPGPKKLLHPDADWVLLVGDMSALPAISGVIEQMADDVVGHAVIEVIDESDIQQLRVPAGVKMHWLVNPHPGENGHLLVDYVKNLQWRSGQPSVWSACEFKSMRQLRDYFRGERQLGNDSLYISSYWKNGSNEDAHRVAKSSDLHTVSP